MNEIQTQTVQPLSIFTDTQKFELAQRVATALSNSTLVPDEFQGKPSNCLIAYELAHRMNMSILPVIQNLNIIHGRPSFSASFIIAQINASGRYVEPLQFKHEGEGDNHRCVAWTIDKKGTVVEGPPVSVAMAKEQKWYNRPHSKWPSMEDLMLEYRAATFFGRTRTPELTMGMQSTEELQDITPAPAPRDVTPQKPTGDINDEIKQAQAKKTDQADSTRNVKANDTATAKDRGRVRAAKQPAKSTEGRQHDMAEQPGAKSNGFPTKVGLVMFLIQSAATVAELEQIETDFEKFTWTEDERAKVDAGIQKRIAEISGQKELL